MYAAFALGPIALGLAIACYDWDPIEGTRRFVGIANLVSLTTDRVVLIALRNNLLWIALSLAIQVPIALLLAAALADASRTSRVLRTVFLSPLVVPAAAVGILFGVVYDVRFGVLNAALSAVAGQRIEIGWIADPKFALLSLIAVACWQYTGYHMMVLLAGMQAIPGELYEAAALDGANWWRRLTAVTIPLLRRVLLVDMLLVAIGSVKVFDIVQVMTKGGPNNATHVLATYMYSKAFMSNQLGAGAAIAVAMLCITLTLALIHGRASRGLAER